MSPIGSPSRPALIRRRRMSRRVRLPSSAKTLAAVSACMARHIRHGGAESNYYFSYMVSFRDLPRARAEPAQPPVTLIWRTLGGIAAVRNVAERRERAIDLP